MNGVEMSSKNSGNDSPSAVSDAESGSECSHSLAFNRPPRERPPVRFPCYQQETELDTVT